MMKTVLQRSGFALALLTLVIGIGSTFSVRAAQFTVNSVADNGTGGCTLSECTLREAVVQANAQAGNDAIVFDPAVFSGAMTIKLAGVQLTIAPNGALTINGTGATRLSISGDNTTRVFSLIGGADLTLNGVTVTEGAASGGAGIFNAGATITLNNCRITGNSGSIGAGLMMSGGTAVLTKSTISGNSAIQRGAGVFINSGAMTLTDSTVSGNFTTGGGEGGGGIQNFGTLTMNTSTVSGNSAGTGVHGGGGILNGGILTLNNCTFSGNSGIKAGGLHNAGGTLSLRNTIISGNTAGADPDLLGLFSAQSENNLIGDFANVRLAPLGFYGGTTQTHALLSGSTATNTGNNCVLTQSCAGFNAASVLATDQRNATRVGQVDIGAFELNNTGNGGTYRAVFQFGNLNVPYSFLITPNNGPFNYNLTGGALPNGLSLTTSFAPNAAVALSGTPLQMGTFNFSVTISDGANLNVTDFVLQILTPTAAEVSVGGRVLVGQRGLPRATVYLTDQRGVTRTALTNVFGYYRFDGISSGETYALQVSEKRYSFAPQILAINEDTSDLNFIAEP